MIPDAWKASADRFGYTPVSVTITLDAVLKRHPDDTDLADLLAGVVEGLLDAHPETVQMTAARVTVEADE